ETGNQKLAASQGDYETVHISRPGEAAVDRGRGCGEALRTLRLVIRLDLDHFWQDADDERSERRLALLVVEPDPAQARGGVGGHDGRQLPLRLLGPDLDASAFDPGLGRPVVERPRGFERDRLSATGAGREQARQCRRFGEGPGRTQESSDEDGPV